MEALLQREAMNSPAMRFYLPDKPEQQLMLTDTASILVVDDERVTCAFLAKILSLNSWHVDTATDGPTALDLVRQNHYDAVVLDYRMPGMNGADLSRSIERLAPGIPRILLTGYPTIDTVYPAVDSGIDRVLAKPVDPEELIAVLTEQLG